jgi:hypothetical protein
MAQLQWIAGMNVGLPRVRQDRENGVVFGHSMIYGVGLRYVGGWLGTRGAISNGFKSGGPSTSEFKVFGTELGDKPDYPLWCGVMEGLPRAFLDDKTPEGYQAMKGAEEWIPHSGAWLSAISRLRQTRKE